MPRRPVVSRTMEVLNVVTLRTDTVKEKTKHESFYIAAQAFKSREDILKYIRTHYDDDRMVTSRIKTVTECTAFVSQSIQAFIDNAEEINVITERKEKA